MRRCKQSHHSPGQESGQQKHVCVPGKDEPNQQDNHHPNGNRCTAGVEVSGLPMSAWPWAVLAQDDGVCCDEGEEDSVLELCHRKQAQQPGVDAYDSCQGNRTAAAI